MANSIYLRLWVKNVGNATAKNVEVYAKELRRKRADGTWERVALFPPMNLKWANAGGLIYFPNIAPEMGKHCDLGHIVDPGRRHLLREDNPKLQLNNDQASLAFDLMVVPNHRGHIIGPGEYQLDLLVAAENARPLACRVSISLRGLWDPDETRMLRDGVGVGVVARLMATGARWLGCLTSRSTDRCSYSLTAPGRREGSADGGERR